MAVDLERMLILLQRRYNSLKEVDRLTNELLESFSRHDEVSASLLLEMRAEEITNIDTCMGQIWDLANAGGEDVAEIRRLMKDDPFQASGKGSWEENKIYEVRRNTAHLLKQIQEKDRHMSLSVGGERSFYRKK